MKKIYHKQWLKERKRLVIFVIIFTLISSRLIMYSLAAPSYGGGGGGGDDSPSNPSITPDPVLTQTCHGDIDIAVAIDVSGDQEPLVQFQQPLTAFVDSLLPSPYVKLSLSVFSTNSGQVLDKLTNNAGALNNNISTIGNGNGGFGGGYGGGYGGTAWTPGLKIGMSTLPGASSQVPQLLILASDSLPSSSDLTTAISEANIIKGDGVHILAAGMVTEHSVPIQTLEDISGTNTDTSSIDVDAMTLQTYQDLGLQLQELAENTCGGSGNGNGNGGSGTGTNGNGKGTTGKGQGTHGTGQGTTGKGKGATGTGPSPTPKPTPTPSPAPTATVSKKPNPAPKPTAQGTKTKPPTPTPSPFYDGKQYAPGSAADTLPTATPQHEAYGWWAALVVFIVASGSGGYLFWRSRLGLAILPAKILPANRKKKSPPSSKISKKSNSSDRH